MVVEIDDGVVVVVSHDTREREREREMVRMEWDDVAHQSIASVMCWRPVLLFLVHIRLSVSGKESVMAIRCRYHQQQQGY